MKGNEAYETQFGNRVDSLIEKAEVTIPCIGGFRDYINDLSPSSVYNYVLYATEFMKYVNKNVSELSLDDYTAYKNSIKKRTPSYQIAVYSGLKKFSTYLYITHRCKEDFMTMVPRPKMRESTATVEKRERGYLNDEELQIFLNNVRSEITNAKTEQARLEAKRNYVIVLVLLSTGMRCSGLYKLNKDSIDFEAKKIITVDKREKVQIYNISDELAEVLKEYIVKIRPWLLHKTGEEALFVSRKNVRLTQFGIWKIIKKFSDGIEGKELSPHKLRATYGTMLYEKTKDIEFVQSCMGHTSAKTTSLYIRGKKDENREKAAGIMTKVIF